MNARMEPAAGNPWELVRRLALPGLKGAADAEQVRKLLQQVPGVQAVECDLKRHRVTVRYDVNQTDHDTLTGMLTEAGYPPASGLLSCLRGSLYQYADTNARDNAKAPPPPCCNKPPK